MSAQTARTRHETARMGMDTRTAPRALYGASWGLWWAHLGQAVGTVVLIAYAMAVKERRDARARLHRAAMLRRLSGGVG